MSLLSQVFGLAFNLINLPFSTPSDGTAKSDNALFPFDLLRSMPEPCTTVVFRMGENELKFTALPRGFCSNCCPTKVQRDIRFVLYTRTNRDQGRAIEPLKPGAAQQAGVNNAWPTVIFIHGFSEASPGQSGRSILDAYFARRENYNLILLDWSELASFPWYQTAVTNVKRVSERLKSFIEVFHDSNEIPVYSLHLVGFSLGSHIAGIGGKLLRQDMRIPRITALDPALPEYSLKVACSHVRAWRLYAESVKNERAFPATRCTVWRGPDRHCNFTTDSYMGYANTGNTRGSFYLITHESTPYGVRRRRTINRGFGR